MSERKWHLEHRDGTEWDMDELARLAYHMRPDKAYKYCILLIDTYGNACLATSLDHLITLEENLDVAVVFDD